MAAEGTTRRMAEAERADFLRLVEGLTPAQWEAPTLCDAWRVRDVVAHVLSFEDLGLAGTAALLVRGRFDVDRVTDLALGPFSAWAPAQLVARMRDHQRPRGLPAVLGGGIALADAMIHQQDIRRPLRLARPIPAARVRRSLQVALRTPTLPSRDGRRPSGWCPPTPAGASAPVPRSGARPRLC